MDARRCLLAAAVVGVVAAMAAAQETQRPPLAYELTIDDRTVEVKDSVTVEVSVGGRKVPVTVRIKPIQHYATTGMEFDYDRSLSLRDDFDEQERMVTLMHGSTTSIVITDLGPIGDTGPRATLSYLTEQMQKRIKRGTYNDLKKDIEEPVTLRLSKGYTTALTYKDEDGDQQNCRIYALESKGRRISVIVQYDGPERETAQSLLKPTLTTIMGREGAPTHRPAQKRDSDQ